jgi:copper transport protein
VISDPHDPARPVPPVRIRARAAVADHRPVVRLLAVLVLSLVVLLVTVPAPAQAHAVLTGSTPGDAEVLDAPPAEVLLTFNEPITANDNALRVFDADGTRIDGGPIGTEADEVAVAMPDELAEGTYVVAYRVVSDDSHPIAGVRTFSVGEAAELDAATIDAIAGTGAGTLGVVGSTLRGVGYLGTLLAAGAVAFAGFVGRRAGDRRRAATLARPAAVLALVATVLHVPVQAAAVSGYGLAEAVTDATAMGDTLTSGFGQSAVLRIVGLIALLVLWRRHRAADGAPATVGALLPVAALATLGSYLLDGHQRSVEPTWLLLGGDAIHVVGAAVWAGGLVLLLATLRADHRTDDPVGAARVVQRFSSVALWSVLALAVAGTAMSLPLVGGVSALTSTTYGILLLVKVALVAVVVAIAAYNRRTLVPAVTSRVAPAGASVDVTPDAVAGRTAASEDAWRRLDTTVRAEAGLLVVVALLTGFLVTTQPAAEAAGLTGPVMATAALGDELEVDLVVDPAAPGLNTLHVYVLEPSGQPSGEVDDLRLEFTYLPEGIGPIEVEPFVAGPGHWTASIEDLRFAGDWEVRVVGAQGRFDEVETTIPFTING